MMTSVRCYWLARLFSSMAKGLPMKDVRYTAEQLLQCVTNVFTIRSLFSISFCSLFLGDAWLIATMDLDG